LSRKLRILQVAPYFYPAWAYGGIPRVVYELSRELVRSGHDVTVCTTDVLDSRTRYPASPGENLVDGVRAYYFKNLSNYAAYRLQVFLPRGLAGFLAGKIEEFDVIHLHGHRHFLNNAAHHYAVRHGKPYVLSGHGTVPRIERRVFTKVLFDRLFGDRILRDAAAFVAVSESEVSQYEGMGVDKAKVRVIYNGIDLDGFARLPREGAFKERYGLRGKKVVLFLGKITPRKGVDFLVRAFARLEGKDAFLVIAGNDMGFKGRVEEIIKECGVGERVLFTGLVTGEEKLSAYRDADVLVYPAVNEIFGLVPFEAIMCGAPVVVTDDCGCGQIIGREKIGYTVRYGDIRGLAETLAGVLRDPSGAREKVARGKAFIRENLNWARIAGEHERLYRGLAP
jgi:glycosyltransferase involved in cell wall biosynthesis